ncbi:hypothetical protein [Listeria ilorinensis]|uniref:hypothetical protein n=1 Tax=Listeria ilorinensis TaxID=2867439 RepID=UPI001EF5457E|nr:hypothetical protein [Listeria ilorinensis]
MQYLFIQFEGIESWIEASDDGYAERQVDKAPDGHFLISNIYDILAEGKISIVADEWTTLISKDDFEQVWSEAKKPYQTIWQEAEQNFHIGQLISVHVRAFYPQGVWFQVSGTYFFGVLKETAAFHTENPLAGPGLTTQLVISGFDPLNQWLILTNNK